MVAVPSPEIDHVGAVVAGKIAPVACMVQESADSHTHLVDIELDYVYDPWFEYRWQTVTKLDKKDSGSLKTKTWKVASVDECKAPLVASDGSKIGEEKKVPLFFLSLFSPFLLSLCFQIEIQR